MMNELEKELAALVVSELNLEDVHLDEVSSDTRYMAKALDSTPSNILEIALLISKKYGFELRSDDPDNLKIFATLGALAQHVAAYRCVSGGEVAGAGSCLWTDLYHAEDRCCRAGKTKGSRTIKSGNRK